MKQITTYINEKANFISKKHVTKNDAEEFKEVYDALYDYTVGLAYGDGDSEDKVLNLFKKKDYHLADIFDDLDGSWDYLYTSYELNNLFKSTSDMCDFIGRNRDNLQKEFKKQLNVK